MTQLDLTPNEAAEPPQARAQARPHPRPRDPRRRPRRARRDRLRRHDHRHGRRPRQGGQGHPLPPLGLQGRARRRRRRLHEDRRPRPGRTCPTPEPCAATCVAMIKPHSIAGRREEAPGHGRPDVDAVARPRTRRCRERGDRRAAGEGQPRLPAPRHRARRDLGRRRHRDARRCSTPSMAAYRLLILRKPVDRAFLVSLIDGVLLPAVGLTPPKP